MKPAPVQLAIFASRVSALCEEMGATLGELALSPNIRDRLDYSSAVFDPQGALIGQATHIPVHLGSMAFAMRSLVDGRDWNPGDVLICNDPFEGGTHLPDVTVIAPVHEGSGLLGFVANRAHFADIGASRAGSMPISGHIDEEGLRIPPSMLVQGGTLDAGYLQDLASRVHSQTAFRADLKALLAASSRGQSRLRALMEEYGRGTFQRLCSQLQDYAERLARRTIEALPDGRWQFEDVMDSDGTGAQSIPLRLTLMISGSDMDLDFSGTADQVAGNINCPEPVTAAAVSYVMHCLMPASTPACAGTLRPVSLNIPEGSLLAARYPAAVAAGNVETSQRVVDLMLGCLNQSAPERIPAASQGTMNNIALGGSDPGPWDYYETVGGGAGGGPAHAGLSGRQTHMTNTLNTPVEVLEQHYPLQVEKYCLRRGSGGHGGQSGGDGVLRQYRLLAASEVTICCERQRHAPWGLAGGAEGERGRVLVNGERVAGKSTHQLEAGSIIRVETPGGGGYGPGIRE